MWYSMIVAIIALILVILVILGLKPFKLNRQVISYPAGSFEETVARVVRIQSAEKKLAQLNPVCSSTLLTHGEKVDRAIVFLHGFTSCPQQFSQLGQEYFEKGYNVYMPRTPRHGIKDRRGNALKG